ncbi:MAG: tetratricopeptide repeat protein [Planctomycetota bacterium]
MLNRIRSSSAAFLVLLAWMLFSTTSCTKRKGAVGLEFEKLRQQVFAGELNQAAQGFEVFLKQHRGHALCARATFLIGKSRLGTGELEEAEKWFSQTMHDYPGSEESNKAQFKIAMIRVMQRDQEAAITELESIVQQANGPYTPEAQVWLAYLKAPALQP